MPKTNARFRFDSDIITNLLHLAEFPLLPARCEKWRYTLGPNLSSGGKCVVVERFT